jgi:hypothetical protein
MDERRAVETDQFVRAANRIVNCRAMPLQQAPWQHNLDSAKQGPILQRSGAAIQNGRGVGVSEYRRVGVNTITRPTKLAA